MTLPFLLASAKARCTIDLALVVARLRLERAGLRARATEGGGASCGSCLDSFRELGT